MLDQAAGNVFNANVARRIPLAAGKMGPQALSICLTCGAFCRGTINPASAQEKTSVYEILQGKHCPQDLAGCG